MYEKARQPRLLEHTGKEGKKTPSSGTDALFRITEKSKGTRSETKHNYGRTDDGQNGNKGASTGINPREQAKERLGKG